VRKRALGNHEKRAAKHADSIRNKMLAKEEFKLQKQQYKLEKERTKESACFPPSRRSTQCLIAPRPDWHDCASTPQSTGGLERGWPGKRRAHKPSTKSTPHQRAVPR
jgi:hypothetical protein